MATWFAGISLRRVVLSSNFIPEVDGFRFVAIMIVIIVHTGGLCAALNLGDVWESTIGHQYTNGRNGVYLFFTISGFILALPFARHHLGQGPSMDIRKYFARRLSRLEPPYVIVMTLRAILLCMLSFSAPADVFRHWLASLFYVHNLVYARYSTINPPAWSLEVEIQFYILAPLLAQIFIIRSAWLRRGLIATAMFSCGLCSTIFFPEGSRASMSLLSYAQYFFAGFLLCDFYLTKVRIKITPLLWDCIGLLSLLWLLTSHSPWYHVILPAASICLYMAGFRGVIAKAVFSNVTISRIGGMCYSIYLTHSLVLAALASPLRHAHIDRLQPEVQLIIVYLISFVAILLSGTIYFIVIERPCMRPDWPQRLRAHFKREKQLSAPC